MYLKLREIYARYFSDLKVFEGKEIERIISILNI